MNDAPIKGSEYRHSHGEEWNRCCKEASSMILLDDNFATIVEAIKEGRKIYDNIRKFLCYLLACNFGEIVAMAIAAFMACLFPYSNTDIMD